MCMCIYVCLSMCRHRSQRKYTQYRKHIERQRTLHTFITCYILLSLLEKYATSSKLSIYFTLLFICSAQYVMAFKFVAHSFFLSLMVRSIVGLWERRNQSAKKSKRDSNDVLRFLNSVTIPNDKLNILFYSFSIFTYTSVYM